MSEVNLSERSVFVTGGASGIGKEISEVFLSGGARVAILDQQFEPEIKRQYQSKWSESVLCLSGDVSSESSVDAAVQAIFGKWGAVDILVNNAGVIYKDVAEDTDVTKWKQVLDINLTGPMICAKKVLPGMKRRGWGRIINIASMFAVTAAETFGAYAASKAGLVQLTKVWALEVARNGITVNAICPGWVETPMIKENLPARIAKIHDITPQEALNKIFSFIPQRRFIDPSEIASLTAYLASDLARGINGAAIVIDTGLSAGMPAGLHRRVS
jgi:NAD(P)-dependent dehydrogenase (short-subunit alcohol dehydrogenase family)